MFLSTFTKNTYLAKEIEYVCMYVSGMNVSMHVCKHVLCLYACIYYIRYVCMLPMYVCMYVHFNVRNKKPPTCIKKIKKVCMYECVYSLQC